MECPKCGTEMVETESWGLRFLICPKCGASYNEKPPSLVDSTVSEEIERSKPQDGSSS